MGGTLARLAAEGHRVVLAVATDGEAGAAASSYRIGRTAGVVPAGRAGPLGGGAGVCAGRAVRVPGLGVVGSGGRRRVQPSRGRGGGGAVDRVAAGRTRRRADDLRSGRRLRASGPPAGVHGRRVRGRTGRYAVGAGGNDRPAADPAADPGGRGDSRRTAGRCGRPTTTARTPRRRRSRTVSTSARMRTRSGRRSRRTPARRARTAVRGRSGCCSSCRRGCSGECSGRSGTSNTAERLGHRLDDVFATLR